MKTPLLNLEEELMVEVWRLLKKNKKVFFLHPAFPLIIKL